MVRKFRLSSLASVCLVVLLLSAYAACGDQESARMKLGQMNIEYSEASFVDRAFKGDILAVKLFIECGMDVNAKNPEGLTPLMAAVAGKRMEVVKMLLEKNADVNAAGAKGFTALAIAHLSGNEEAAKLLLAKGAENKFFGRYTISPEKVITDTKTGLEWYVGPDRDTTWDQAQSWASSLKVAGGGWRLPNRRELPTLYQQGLGERNMAPIFQTTGWYLWSGEAKDASSAYDFDFNGGQGSGAGPRNGSNGVRAFAVRSRK
jgi:hypothetical protein